MASIPTSLLPLIRPSISIRPSWITNMLFEINSRTAGKESSYTDPANSTTMPLFSNIGAGYTGSTFVPNEDLWCNDIRAQLTGIHMGAGNYLQSYGLMPLGDHFALNCGHNGPEHNEPGGLCTVKYVDVDGTVGTAVSNARANAFLGLDAEVVAAGVPSLDMQVYAFSTPIPAFAYRAPLMALSPSNYADISRGGGEFLAISQGNRTDRTGYSNTPKNRKVYKYNPQTAGWGHRLTVGDSGTPKYVLLNGFLSLVEIISGEQITAVNIGHLNTLISIAASRAGVSPITVSLAPNPS
jgi:hypothetical protein